MPTFKPDMKVVIIAGPNGAGKTTFAREFLPTEAGWRNFNELYRSRVDVWKVYDNAGTEPVLLEEGS